jgi:hypothetical protein
VRIVPGKAGEADQLDQGRRAVASLGLGKPALQVEAVRHVLEHRAPGKQAVVLEHHGAVRPRAVHRVAVEEDRTGSHRHEAVDRIEEGRLAAARRPDDGHELALEHRKVDVVQDRQQLPGSFVVKVERDAAHLQLRSASRLHRVPVSWRSEAS